MIADASNQISGIYWNVYGKIDSIARKPGSLMNDMEFHYNAMGNRTCKIVKPRTPAGNRKTQDQWQYTYYVHDASGNIMATYTKKFVQPSAYQGTYSPIGNLQDVSFNKETNSIYGCARIGEKIYTNSDNALASAVLDVNPTLNVNQTYSINAIAAYSQFLRPATASNSTRILTEKTYELTNHLGNVMATIYDRKLPVQSTTNASVAINYIPDVASTTDYYAFVAELTGRSFNSKSARYGLWGQEKLNELEGEGDNYLTFFRLLDTRIGRWLEIDPKPDASESPYANSHNNGERYNDPAGDCADCKTEAKASVSLTFGTKNQSRINFAVAIGASKMSGSLMGSTNLSLNVYNGGPGTNQASTGMNTWGGALTLGISGTLGGGSGTPTELNIFNSSTLSAVSNSFGNSVTLGTNLTLKITHFYQGEGFWQVERMRQKQEVVKLDLLSKTAHH